MLAALLAIIRRRRRLPLVPPPGPTTMRLHAGDYVLSAEQVERIRRGRSDRQ